MKESWPANKKCYVHSFLLFLSDLLVKRNVNASVSLCAIADTLRCSFALPFFALLSRLDVDSIATVSINQFASDVANFWLSSSWCCC